MSAASCKAGTVCGQLGTYHPRSMGTTSHTRVPCKQPHSVKSALTNPASIGPESCSYTGGLKVAGQRGYCPGNSKPHGLYLTAFSRPQKGWGSKACVESEGTKQIHTMGTLPDGGPTHAPRHTDAQQLDGQAGPKRCLPAGAHPPSPPPVPKIPVGRENVPLPVSPLRALIRAMSVYEDHETSSGLPQASRDSAVDMSGRHADPTPGEDHSPTTGRPCDPVLPITGPNCQQEKSVLDPTQALEFLGFTIRTLPMTIHLPKEKLRKIKQEAQSLLAQEMVTIKDLASFIGKISASSRAIRIAPLHYRSLQKMVNSVVPYHYSDNEIRRKYSISLPLTPEAQDNLQWWTYQLKQFNTAPIQSPTLNLIIESDASNMGWGAACQGARTGGLWSKQEALHHINYLKLLAAFLALKSFTKGKRDLSILLNMDSITALTYVNKMGGPHSYLLCSLALTMWNWCLQRHFWIKAEHLPGILNRAADTESQTVKDRCDWMLNPQIFTQLRSVMGPLHVDLFASRLTHQLPRFFSWRPDPEAEAVDAFTQDWSQIRGPGLCQPTMVSHTTMSDTHQTPTGKSPSDCPLMEDSTMVPSPSEDVGGLSQDPARETRPDTPANRSGIHHESGPNSGRMAYLRDSFQSRGL